MFSNDILDRTPKTQSIELITDKLDFIKITSSVQQKIISRALNFRGQKSFKDSTKRLICVIVHLSKPIEFTP